MRHLPRSRERKAQVMRKPRCFTTLSATASILLMLTALLDTVTGSQHPSALLPLWLRRHIHRNQLYCSLFSNNKHHLNLNSNPCKESRSTHQPLLPMPPRRGNPITSSSTRLWVIARPSRVSSFLQTGNGLPVLVRFHRNNGLS